MAKIFTEQKAIGFYGFENHYGQEHISLFITIVGFTYMNYIFFMRGRISRVYQWAIGVGIVMMIFPIFSYVLSATTDSPYTRWINMLPIVQTMILAHVFDRYGFEQVKMKNLTIPIVISLGALAFVFQYYLKRLGTDEKFVSRDVLTADTYLMVFAGIVLLVILVFGWMKKHQWIKRMFWVEFIVALVYIYTGPFAIANKIDTFQSMRSIDDFLVESIDEEEFFRVYVDLYRFDVERLNFNRMTTFPTNTEIFHSWTDEATNEISLLLYQAREYQTKDKMSAQAIYLNHVLGYKYVLLDATKNYVLDPNIYTLINQDAQFKLYEIASSEPFQVYESFITNTAFQTISGSANRIAVQKLLLLNVLLETERTDVQLIQTAIANPESMQSAASTNPIAEATLVQDVANGTYYYRYSNADFKIGFSTGAIYIKSTWLNPEDYGRVYVEFADMTQRECEVRDDQSHQVKCEFWQEPTYIFFEKTTRFNSVKALQYRLEAAIDSAAYLVFNFPETAFDSTSGLVYFNLSSGTKLERVFFTDASGAQTEAFEGYYYFSGSSPARVYVYKTNEMYQLTNLFNLKINYVYDDLSDYREFAPDAIASDQSMTIRNGVIRLSYQRSGDADQIVMIPVAYSEEWVVQGGAIRNYFGERRILGRCRTERQSSHRHHDSLHPEGIDLRRAWNVGRGADLRGDFRSALGHPRQAEK
ncbi:MAG: hypothetical protein MZU97_15375 [Bacillus subtilis]|nr:hypothetical protein [Bacillus subtilis]